MNNSEIEKAYQHIIKSTDVELTGNKTASFITLYLIGIGVAIVSLIAGVVWAIFGGSIGVAARTVIGFVIGGYIGAWITIGVNVLPSRKQKFRVRFFKARKYLHEGKWNQAVEISSEVVMLALSDRDPHIRSQAAIALGKARSEEAVPVLCKALAEDPDPEVRRNVAEALGIIGDEEIEVKS